MAWKDINNLEVYQLGMEISESVYSLVQKWDSFNKNTIGYQLMRSIDSISANISEGFGRFHYRDQRRFCHIARGSLYESKTWLVKARCRIVDNEDQINKIFNEIGVLHIKLNGYIRYIEKQIDSNK